MDCTHTHTHSRVDSDQVQGTLPSELALLTKLTYLDLSSNLITGRLPDLTPLTALTSLLLGDNALLTPEPLPNLGNLTNLRYIDMWGTKRTGTLPASYAALNQLRDIDVSGNEVRA
jgi:Leucine-rich repeat (LRR) protein